MSRNLRWIWIIVMATFAACASSKEIEDVWVNKEKMQDKAYSNLFIVALTADVEVRAKLENDLAEAARQRGFKAIKSIDVLEPVLKDPKAPTKEEVVGSVRANNCDAVFIASLFKKEEGVQYTPGGTAYAIGPNYAYTGNYFGYYSYWHPTVSTPSYYSHDKNYFIQSNLYDAASEEIVCAVQSKVFNPASLNDFCKTYINTLLGQLEKDKFLKKHRKDVKAGQL